MYFACYLYVCVCVCVVVYVCMLRVLCNTVGWRGAPRIGQACLLPTSALFVNINPAPLEGHAHASKSSQDAHLASQARIPRTFVNQKRLFFFNLRVFIQDLKIWVRAAPAVDIQWNMKMLICIALGAVLPCCFDAYSVCTWQGDFFRQWVYSHCMHVFNAHGISKHVDAQIHRFAWRAQAASWAQRLFGSSLMLDTLCAPLCARVHIYIYAYTFATSMLCRNTIGHCLLLACF